MKRIISIGIGLILFLFLMTIVLPLAFPGRVPPTEITRSRMAFDRQRILEYARDHNQLPPDLSALPRLALKPEADHYFEDGWHRRITYEVDPSGMVTLISLGKDGVPGGSGDNADILFSFVSRRSDGSWSEASDGYNPPK
jgi:hypothetical protein